MKGYLSQLANRANGQSESALINPAAGRWSDTGSASSENPFKEVAGDKQDGVTQTPGPNEIKTADNSRIRTVSDHHSGDASSNGIRRSINTPGITDVTNLSHNPSIADAYLSSDNQASSQRDNFESRSIPNSSTSDNSAFDQRTFKHQESATENSRHLLKDANKEDSSENRATNEFSTRNLQTTPAEPTSTDKAILSPISEQRGLTNRREDINGSASNSTDGSLPNADEVRPVRQELPAQDSQELSASMDKQELQKSETLMSEIVERPISETEAAFPKPFMPPANKDKGTDNLHVSDLYLKPKIKAISPVTPETDIGNQRIVIDQLKVEIVQVSTTKGKENPIRIIQKIAEPQSSVRHGIISSKIRFGLGQL